MNVGIIDVDGHSGFPNHALMKLTRHHRQHGDNVEIYTPFGEYDVVYMSKVFSFTEEYGYTITNAKKIIKGGTGYDWSITLPDEIDHLQPDYSTGCEINEIYFNKSCELFEKRCHGKTPLNDGTTLIQHSLF